MSAAPPAHVGRFAPSPTGPLHFGSLVAALGSHTAARAAGGQWHLRIDDLDRDRQTPEAVTTILHQLEAHGLTWDAPPLYQTTATDRYASALERLRSLDAVYPCTCSRSEVTAVAATGALGPVYPGWCRRGAIHPRRHAAVRLRLPAGRLALTDAVRGEFGLDTAAALGDPVLRRRDGFWAYHLATAVDDAALGITDVVRGADLLPPALVQLALQAPLELPAVHWTHLPLVQAASGDKLSKQTGAQPLDPTTPLPALLAAWRLLGQAEPPERPVHVDEFHAWARDHWSVARVPATSTIAPTDTSGPTR